MSLTVETVAILLQDKTALDLHTVVSLRCTCKSFCTTVTGHFPDIELRLDPSSGRLLVGVDLPSSQIPRQGIQVQSKQGPCGVRRHLTSSG